MSAWIMAVDGKVNGNSGRVIGSLGPDVGEGGRRHVPLVRSYVPSSALPRQRFDVGTDPTNDASLAICLSSPHLLRLNPTIDQGVETSCCHYASSRLMRYHCCRNVLFELEPRYGCWERTGTTSHPRAVRTNTDPHQEQYVRVLHKQGMQEDAGGGG
ncbi:hypothetical protein PENSPDRAFT_738821 [Peniophora sp. CONT]|nr:hypothetical protein PENSPDRAFT_738821 [Peniophora sp. CONT]